MNRSEYLRDSSVEAFIDWLRPHIRGDCRFQHKFTLLKPHRDWSCNSIWEAYENYWWPIPGRNTGSFEANQGELDRLAAAVRRARDGDNPDGFIEAACGILRWGGVTRSNGKTLRDLGGAALSTFRAASLLLDPSHADTSRLDGVRYMNAGWTKVYALMLDGLPIYDGARWRGNGLSRAAVLRQRPPLPGSDAAAFPVGCGKGEAQPQPVDALAPVPGADRHHPPDVGGVQPWGGVDPGRGVPRR